uniref:Microtubule-associated protein Jupiter n=1 Tax=Culex tarsalis TaxID=7177 RepID=A0A1Q3FUY6_CULTA
MTSTNFSIGFGEGSKASSKVLKPPGGGSSDLFGADNNQPQTPRSMNKNRMQSNIFAVPEGQRAGNGETPRRAANGQDSHNRLFGEVDRPYTPAKNHMKSNLPIGPADQPDSSSSSSSNGKANGHSNGHSAAKTNGHQHGNGHANGHSNGHSNGTSSTNGHSNGTSSAAPSQNGSTHKNGNPVTGEGYKSGGAAEINTSIPSLNGSGHVINKNRIPPGGFSSGLW